MAFATAGLFFLQLRIVDEFKDQEEDRRALPLAGTAVAACRFLQRPESSRSRLFEPFSALWVLLTYLGLGALPHLAGC